MSKQNTQNEFKKFKDLKGENPPATLNESVLNFVQNDLNPKPLFVFTKLSLIHFVSALVTLSICPQFGFKLGEDSMGLMHYFMDFGPVGCAIACGGFFLGTTLFAASVILKPQEILAIRSHRFVSVAALVLLSLSFFLMIDAQALLKSITLAWAIGSFISGLIVLEAGYMIKKQNS